jgi:hypothetical protein
MSYLMLSDGVLDFSKAVISFWFRVPQESIDKVNAAWTGEDGVLLNGIIPLVVMGKRGTGQVPYQLNPSQTVLYSFDSEGWINTTGTVFSYIYLGTGGRCVVYSPDSPEVEGHWDTNIGATITSFQTSYSYAPITNTQPSGSAPARNPTCIGIDCNGINPCLYVNFETAMQADISSFAYELQSIVPGHEFQPAGTIQQGTLIERWCAPPIGLLVDQIPGSVITISDTTTTVGDGGPSVVTDPEYNYVDITDVSINGTGAITSNVIPVSADTWHHVLVCIDLKTEQTHGVSSDSDPVPPAVPISTYVDSASQLYVALDDVNYTGWDLSNNWNWGGDPNEVLTNNAWNVAGTRLNYDRDGNVLGEAASYTLTDPTVPSDGQPLGVPGTADTVDNIYHVEMAEFVMFPGVTLDTSIEKNRRLFITNKDKEGRQFPVNPTPTMIPISKLAIGDPATWEPGADTPAFVPPLSALDPSNMSSGNKQLGMPAVDFTKSSMNWMAGHNLGSAKGKVVRTGKIKAYSPDPSLSSDATPGDGTSGG